MNSPTKSLRDPSLTIHRSIYSCQVKSLGASLLISPDISIRANDGYLNLSDSAEDWVSRLPIVTKVGLSSELLYTMDQRLRSERRKATQIFFAESRNERNYEEALEEILSVHECNCRGREVGVKKQSNIFTFEESDQHLVERKKERRTSLYTYRRRCLDRKCRGTGPT